MKIKSSIAAVIMATTMIAAVPSQAMCCRHVDISEPGWHMVPKSADIRPASNWQEYASGVYLQPVTGRGMLFLAN